MDLGFIGGGLGFGMVYIFGVVDYKFDNDKLVDYIVEFVEKKVVEIEVE